VELRAWMDLKDIDIYEASRAFGVSTFAVKKWLNKERTPRSAMQIKVKKITKGEVCPNDWIKE
jgi:hypothetical protein